LGAGLWRKHGLYAVDQQQQLAAVNFIEACETATVPLADAVESSGASDQFVISSRAIDSTARMRSRAKHLSLSLSLGQCLDLIFFLRSRCIRRSRPASAERAESSSTATVTHTAQPPQPIGCCSKRRGDGGVNGISFVSSYGGVLSRMIYERRRQTVCA